MQGWFQQMPLLDPRRQAEILAEGMALWETVLAQYGLGPKAAATPRPKSHCRARTSASPTPRGASSRCSR
jgi:polyhydroxyalkanoate synthase